MGSVQTFSGGFSGWKGGGEKVERVFPWRNLSWEKIISTKGAHDILALFKTKTKQLKNKYGKVFSTESKEQH